MEQQLPDISARELQTVVALAEWGSFIAASASMNTSQPAITRTLKRLERALGVTLFSRTTRRVEITPAGREFLAVAERVLTDLGIAVRNMREVGNEQRGLVIVSTYSAFACQSLPAILKRYRSTRPLIDVRLREGRQPDIIDDVRSGVADFGVGFVNTLPESLTSVTLRREPLYVMMPPDHPLSQRRVARVPLERLRDEPLVGLPGDSFTRQLVDRAAAAGGFALRAALVVTRFESVLQYVTAGGGLGIVPAGALPARPWKTFHAAPLSAPALSVTLGIIRLQGRYMTPAAMSLMRLIDEATHATR